MISQSPDIHKMKQEIEYTFEMLFEYDDKFERFGPGSKLADPETLQAFINAMCKGFETKKRAVAVSMCIKYLSRALCGVLYAMSGWNRSLNGSLANIELLLPQGKGIAPMLIDASWTDCPDGGAEARAAWREQTCRQLFEEGLRPFFDVLASAVKLTKQTMWENAVVYIHYFYKEWLKTADETARQQLQDDYRYITETAPGYVFGRKSGNPFAVSNRIIPHPGQACETLRIRNTCCLRLLLNDGVSCTTCPRIDDETRLTRFAQKA